MVLILQIAFNTGCVICGIVTAALTGSVEENNQRRCLLYGVLQFNTATNEISVVSSSKASLCGFVLFTSVFVILFNFLHMIYNCYRAAKGGISDRVPVGCWVVYAILLIFLIATGCILRVGRQTMCDSLPVPPFSRCEDAQKYHWVDIGPWSKTFYTYLYGAEVSVWVNMCLLIMSGGLEYVIRSLEYETIDNGWANIVRRALGRTGNL